MQWPSWLVRLVPYLGRQAETELEEEWRFHLERETDENLGRGLATSEAARQAKIRLGNRALVLEDTRAVWGWRWWDEFRQDAGLAVRMLARSPGFSLAAILTLTLGIGATTAIFSVVDSVLLTPLPYPEPERLTRIGQVSTDADRIYAMSYRDFHDLQARNRSFETLAAALNTRVTVLGDADPESYPGAWVSPEFFATLGVSPALGRVLTPEDNRRAARVAVVSHGLWQRRWAGDPTLVGRSLILNQLPFTVVGILPQSFRPPEALGQRGTEFWPVSRGRRNTSSLV